MSRHQSAEEFHRRMAKRLARSADAVADVVRSFRSFEKSLVRVGEAMRKLRDRTDERRAKS